MMIWQDSDQHLAIRKDPGNGRTLLVAVKGTQRITEPKINLTVIKNNSKTVRKKLFGKGAKKNPYIVRKLICGVCQKITEGNKKGGTKCNNLYIYIYIYINRTYIKTEHI